MVDKDHLVEPEDVISDAIWEAIEDSNWEGDIKINHDNFFREINYRSKRVRIELAFKILGAKDRKGFEEIIYDLYKFGSE